MSKPLEEAWALYMSSVIEPLRAVGAEIHDESIEVVRDAFYIGANFALRALVDGADEESIVTGLKAMQKELAEYTAKMGERKIDARRLLQ